MQGHISLQFHEELKEAEGGKEAVRETFKDRKKKTERGILGNSKRESACLEQLPKTRALGEGGGCKVGAEDEAKNN